MSMKDDGYPSGVRYRQLSTRFLVVPVSWIDALRDKSVISIEDMGIRDALDLESVVCNSSPV